MELYLIRHGQSTNNFLMEDQSLRSQDPELTDTGKEQAKTLANYLATGINRERLVRYLPDAPERQQAQPFIITHLYCSAMYRAMQTAQPIAAALKLKPEIWLDIHEHGGIYLKKNGVATGYSGRTRAEITSEFP
ncbi:MAG TPA: histidine phosphatase family protein, partial [Phototrophicaceae bacterium]|nr:histidine phosphatase family protein [Phototrophicaceae bacterium]